MVAAWMVAGIPKPTEHPMGGKSWNPRTGRSRKIKGTHTMTAKEAIKQEAEECAKSANDQRNTPGDREIFDVLSIVLGGIAEKIDSPNDQAQRPAK